MQRHRILSYSCALLLALSGCTSDSSQSNNQQGESNVGKQSQLQQDVPDVVDSQSSEDDESESSRADDSFYEKPDISITNTGQPLQDQAATIGNIIRDASNGPLDHAALVRLSKQLETMHITADGTVSDWFGKSNDNIIWWIESRSQPVVTLEPNVIYIDVLYRDAFSVLYDGESYKDAVDRISSDLHQVYELETEKKLRFKIELSDPNTGILTLEHLYDEVDNELDPVPDVPTEDPSLQDIEHEEVDNGGDAHDG